MFATVAEFEAYMQTTLTEAQKVVAETILEAVSEHVERYTWNKFEITSVTDEMYVGKGGNTLVLRHYPIVSLEAIRYEVSGGQIFPLDVAPMILNKETGVVKCYTPTYISVFGYYRDPFPTGMPILVSYTHGYDKIPAGVKLACLIMANKLYVAPKDESMFLQAEKIGKYEYRVDAYRSNINLIDKQVEKLLAPYVKRQVY